MKFQQKKNNDTLVIVTDTKYNELEKKIAITFVNRELLDMAFVHRSYLNEHPKRECNERLEFLGDAVLELVTTEFLYRTFPEIQEGELTNYRAALVKGKHLAEVAMALDLGKYLYLSNGEERTGGRDKRYILANTIEALIGAIYLDQGFVVAHGFIDAFLLVNLGDILKRGLHIDSKTHFQELAQDKLGMTPHYKLLKGEGPDHDKIYTMGAYLGDELVGTGDGSSKQKAEQQAAASAVANKFHE